jgi:hypothetical protein
MRMRERELRQRRHRRLKRLKARRRAAIKAAQSQKRE